MNHKTQNMELFTFCVQLIFVGMNEKEMHSSIIHLIFNIRGMAIFTLNAQGFQCQPFPVTSAVQNLFVTLFNTVD